MAMGMSRKKPKIVYKNFIRIKSRKMKKTGGQKKIFMKKHKFILMG